jgi:ribonucleoside-triphosphate reductase (formate)
MIDTKVLKRDGRDELFHPYKIGDAITAAFKSVGKEVDGGVLIQVFASLEAQASTRPQVEGIQDLIERTLFDRGHFEVLQSFTRYRFLHKMQRERLGGAAPSSGV